MRLVFSRCLCINTYHFRFDVFNIFIYSGNSDNDGKYVSFVFETFDTII